MALPKTSALPAGIQSRYAEWMSPNAPMAPAVPAGTEGRRVDFPVGYNYAYVPRSYDGISFEQLRNMADADFIVRACMETVKDQMGKLTYRFGLRPTSGDVDADKARKDSDKDPDVAEIKKFFDRPDGEHDFQDWARLLWEDMLAIDAMNLMVDGTPGNIRRLIPTDGSMYHVNIDRNGLRPAPPDPAYTQVVKGMPSVPMTSDQLIYMPRNIRTNRMYGMGPVEQMLFFMNIALRRDISKLSIYTVGNVPEALIAAPQSWSPGQIQQFQELLDSTLSGQLQNRRKLTMVPNIGDPGKPQSIKDAVLFTKEDIIKDEFDEWRARVTCFFFSLPPSAFVKQMNRASAEQQQRQALEEGIEPRKIWFKQKMDYIISYFFKKPNVEFNWEDDEEVDPLVQAQVDKIYISCGKNSVDEIRERDGEPKLGIGNFVLVANGPILLKDVISGEGKVLPNKEPDPELVGGASGAMGGGGARRTSSGKAGTSQSGNGGSRGTAVQKMLKAAENLLEKKNLDIRTDVLPEKTEKRKKVLAASLTRFLKSVGHKIAYHAADLYGMHKATDDDKRTADILASLDLDWVQVVSIVEGPLAESGRETAENILMELGMDTTPLFDVVNQYALDYAHDRAAEMVGKKWVDGHLVDNPNAQYAISETTRDEVKAIIEKAFSDGMTPRQLADQLEDSFQFSDSRAKLIAQTEMTKAHIEGALYAAKETGLVQKKFSRLSNSHDVDDQCDDNEEAGEIPLNQDFPDGSSGPPFHPGCLCTLSFVYGRPKES